MQDFVSGILESNEVTERYHGIAFAHQLNIRTLAGKTLRIDDPDAIAADLNTGKTYKLVIVVTGIERVRAFKASTTATSRISGTIRSLSWEPNRDHYCAINETIAADPLSVIGTAYGHVLLPRMLLGGVVVGNAVTWGKDSYNLVAVYA